jgi:2-keto-4-pentenoate hydratase
MGDHRPAAQPTQRLQNARAHAPPLAAGQHDANHRAGSHRTKNLLRLRRHALHYAARIGADKGETNMAFSVAKAAAWIHSVHKARAVVGWWPAQYTIDDERTAYKVQDAVLKKLVPKEGPLVGYKIALTSPQIWEQTGLRGPAYGPIRRKRVFEHKASVRADRWARLGVELEIILTVNADVPAPKGKGKAYDKDSIAPYVGDARAGFELIDDRGADYSRLSVNWLVMDVGWNGGSLLARPNKNWRKLDLANLSGSIAFDGTVVRTGHSGDVLGHCYNSLAWLANKLGEHGKRLGKGMIVSTGSMVACQFVPPGSTAVGRVEGLGEVTLKYELPK